ncbi:DUF6199 family natural product biosynthesis protein [Gorillibacterium massiliense]|uniref:DUF6199 family natural product biosynthesis protein n=1 Tax=Gorillibacterium massiliense TaxID=1280390 RepID=UPI0004B5396D|nr:DUF6199 family natural product biosynthesis protein [Gorillibacterium massiliense]
MMLFVLLFIVMGILNVIFPGVGWRMRYGWMMKGDAEPSDAYLFMSRIGGIVVVIIGLYLLVHGSFVFSGF